MKKTILLAMTIISVGLVTACNMYQTNQANKFVDEANKAITEANDKMDKVRVKFAEMENAIRQFLSENDLEVQSAVAKEIIPILEKARDSYKEASGKFEDASKLKLQDKFKEYLEYKAKEMKKRSEAAELMIGEPKTLISSDSKSEYQKTVDDLVAKFKSVRAEADDLGAKADKITEENKEIFKVASN
jgi:hypothetical protein